MFTYTAAVPIILDFLLQVTVSLQSTGCGPLSNSDLGMSRSSIFRLGTMEGGLIMTSHNSGSGFPFDESQRLNPPTYFAKRQGDCFSRCTCTQLLGLTRPWLFAHDAPVHHCRRPALDVP